MYIYIYIHIETERERERYYVEPFASTWRWAEYMWAQQQ